MLRAGIVGLPNVGKSTLFNALTATKNAQSANYPFCTIEPNVGIVTVPDERLQVLADLCKSKEIIPTVIEFVDIAGLVKGASQGEGLGNQFLHNIREVDAIIQVVRCFDDENTIHVSGKVDPISDIETINTELALADLASIERRIARITKQAKGGDKNAKLEENALNRLTDLLSAGTFINLNDHFNEDEIAVIKQLNLMSVKPVIYCANVSEFDFNAYKKNANKTVEGLVTAASKVKYPTSGNYCLAVVDYGMVVAMQKILGITDDGCVECFSPAMNHNEIEKAIGVKFPKMGINEFAKFIAVSLEEIKNRLAKLVDSGEISRKTANIIYRIYRRTSNGVVIIPAIEILKNLLAGMDFDGDAIQLYFDEEIVETLWSTESVAVIIDKSDIDVLQTLK